MAKTKNDLFASFKEQVMQNQVSTPLQTIVPVKDKPAEEAFTVHIPSYILKGLRMKAAELTTKNNKVSIKDLIVQALDTVYQFKED